jgi:hypothetical protein
MRSVLRDPSLVLASHRLECELSQAGPFFRPHHAVSVLRFTADASALEDSTDGDVTQLEGCAECHDRSS